jgi:hypothetical protein
MISLLLLIGPSRWLVQVVSASSSPPPVCVLCLLSCTAHIGWRKVTKICLFGSPKHSWLSVHPPNSLRWLVTHAVTMCTYQPIRELKIWSDFCFWLAHHNDWFRWFAIRSSSPPPICCVLLCPSFSFMGGVAKKTK